jgi:hypothetical protein
VKPERNQTVSTYRGCWELVSPGPGGVSNYPRRPENQQAGHEMDHYCGPLDDDDEVASTNRPRKLRAYDARLSYC